MDKQLHNLITRVKIKLEAEPKGIIYGEFYKGNTDIKSSDKVLKPYFEFLGVTDGARCGVMDFWSFNELGSHQYRIADLIGGLEKWIEIGQILYEPLVIDKHSGEVFCFEQGYQISTDKSLGDFNYFISNYVFGPKYKEFVPDVDLDDWFQFLKRIKFD
ncbi:hypothetical protein KQI74_21690 [Paenibacillus barcinonensis]|uniref:hypothetical protein n=1 Tax=Paenibacillus TaxID=44249 RepID=UPI0011AAE525|nr:MULTISPECIES: hypothetical protein [Paenibacillus]MBU5354914.1 hypothetical protein [Paenibacillus barcinonensis]MDM5275749.1 hypothetical protein [Paenibacillus silvae]